MEYNQLPEKRDGANTAWKTKWQPWLKRLGLAGFLFFLFKGLVWIGIFVGMGKCIAQ